MEEYVQTLWLCSACLVPDGQPYSLSGDTCQQGKHLKHHEEYLRLGKTVSERCLVYRELFRCQLSEEDLHRIRKAAHYCQPVGDDRFRQQIARQYGIKQGQMRRGRPVSRPGDVFKY